MLAQLRKKKPPLHHECPACSTKLILQSHGSIRGCQAVAGIEVFEKVQESVQ